MSPSATTAAVESTARREPTYLTRRRVLGLALTAAGAIGAARARNATATAPIQRSTRARRRLVVVGASFAGIALAQHVKRLAPTVEITLIEREPVFVFRPAQLRYVFGLVPFGAVARDYRVLSARGLPVRRGDVAAIDRDRARVVTTDGPIEYDHLALATGMRLAHEEIPGLAGRSDANLCPFERGAGLDRLRQRIESFTGGHVLIATPIDPYTCPPAPYEYALAWAAHIRRRHLKARVTLIEPRSRPTPPAIAEGLSRAIEAYDGTLAYEPFTQVRAIDPVARVAETEVGRLDYDLLSVVPPHRAMSFIADAGLGAPFAEVDPATFRSTRDERIYALGDTADTPFAKTGYTAMDSARVAAAAIARDLGVQAPAPALPANMCYPMVAPDRALLIETHWTVERDQSGASHVTVTGRHDNQARASHARLRRQWETRAMSTLFGT